MGSTGGFHMMEGKRIGGPHAQVTIGKTTAADWLTGGEKMTTDG